MKILSVVGARPNFMKVAPLHRAFQSFDGVESTIVHTGQHHDARMSDVFFDQLELPNPDYFLGVRSGTQTQQTADIMLRFEQVVQTENPDWVVVVGDVTSTLACALVAVRMGVRVAHVEAGLRSGDRRMPEEINRILTDALADRLFVTEQAGLDNLDHEGVDGDKVHWVGNVLIDSLIRYRQKARTLNYPARLQLSAGRYVVMTMHRPANVDTETGLKVISQIVANVASLRTVVFPVHPRTRKKLQKFGLMDQLENMTNVRLLDPQGYLEFLSLVEQAALVITDSGGLQEETTFLQIPCLTFRSSTERPVTVELGTNQLIPDLTPDTVQANVVEILSGRIRSGSIPPLWDGHAANRIAAILAQGV